MVEDNNSDKLRQEEEPAPEPTSEERSHYIKKHE